MGCPLRNILVVFTALLTFYVGLSAFWRSNKLQEDTKLVDSKQTRQQEVLPHCKPESTFRWQQLWGLFSGTKGTDVV